MTAQAQGRERMSESESALIILVPEADAQVGSFRERYDTSAKAGLAAHITLLYPFKRPDQIDTAVLAGLASCIAEFSPFRYSLARAGRLPGVLCLAPEPAEPFRRLTEAIWERHPETPPYGGRHDDIVPHLTVAQVSDAHHLDRIAHAFARIMDGQGPISAFASEVALIDDRSGRWQVRTTMALGGGE